MAIDPAYLPVDAPVIGYAFNVSLAITTTFLAGAACPTPSGQWSVYALAVYNLGGSNLINFAQDQTGRTYFRDLRKDLGIASFQMGVVSSTADQGTSTALLNPEFMKTLTLQNLQSLKDPYGRAYLMFAQAAGPVWGLT